MVGGAKLHLGSNPIPTREAWRVQILFCIRTHDTAQTEPDLPLSVWVSPVEVQVSSDLSQGQGLWVQQTWVWHKTSWRKSPLNPPWSHQNLYRIGATEAWRAEMKSCVHQDQGETSSDPTRDWPRFACECPGVSVEAWVSSGLLQGQRHWVWQYMHGTLERGHDHLHYLHHSLVSHQTTGREHSLIHQ